ncbi:MAG: hypothetical protein IJO70_02320 [Lachnospiraceae bacterium]|nr:hypothetical protein [Lachnospiraceae bacterium]
MKRKSYIALIILVLLFSLSACGKDKEKEVADTYSEDFDKLYSDIGELKTHSDTVSGIVTYTWEEAGPDKTKRELSNLIAFDTSTPETSMDYCDIAYFIEGNTTIDYRFGEFTAADKAKVDAIVIEYQTSYNELSSLDAAILSELKEFKNKHNEKHPEGVSALTDYYTETSSYANLALNPTGSLMDYMDNVSTFKTSIDSLKKAADLAK